MSVLTCSPEIAGKRYIVADMSEECGTAEHTTHVVLAVLAMLVFSLGFPVSVWYVLFKRRHKLHSDVRTMRRFLFLYQGYKRAGWLPYWETAVMMRKAALVIVAAALADNRHGHQLYAGLAVLLAAAVAQIAVQPFEDATQARLENASLTVSACSLCEWCRGLPCACRYSSCMVYRSGACEYV